MIKTKEFLAFHDRLYAIYKAAASTLFKDPYVDLSIMDEIDSWCNIESNWRYGEPDRNAILINFGLIDSGKTNEEIIEEIVYTELRGRERAKQDRLEAEAINKARAIEEREAIEWEIFSRLKKQSEENKVEDYLK